MNRFKAIRERLALTQAQLAEVLGMSQGNVSFYEKGQTVPPETARKLIDIARSRGVCLTFDHVYTELALPEAEQPAAPTPAEAPHA